jgi:hypothetical protein
MGWELRIIFIRRDGKRGRIDLYNSNNWWEGIKLKKWRIKVNGKWYGGREKIFLYKSEIKEILWGKIEL